MPTDESYLDSLLNGLTSGDKKPDNNDRFSDFRKKMKEEDEITRVEDEEEAVAEETTEEPTEEAEEAEVTEEPEEPEELEEPSFVLPNEEEEPVTGPEPVTSFTTGEIENYNIFNDYDDAAIDEIINKELSGEETHGELFSVSGDDGSAQDEEEKEVLSGDENELDSFFGNFEDAASDTADEDPGKDDEMPDFSDLIGGNDTVGSEEANTENAAEGDALDTLFGNLFKDETPEGASNDIGALSGLPKDNEDLNFDNFDFFSGAGNEVITDSQMENHLADEVFNIEADSEEEQKAPELADSEDIFSLKDQVPEQTALFEEEDPSLFEEENPSPLGEENPPQIEENADNFVPEYEDPMAGFTFNAEESEQESPENIGISSMLGDMGVESFNEDDLAALDNLLNEIDIEKPEEEKPKAKKSAVAKDKLPWYIQLFGNVKIPEDKIKPEIQPEELEKKKAEQAEAKKALKEAKKEEKAEKKKAAAEAKALKARQSAEERELARKKKLEQASTMILEDVGNTTKLNKWGILVIFALFIGIVAVVVSGGSTLAYNIGVRQATKLFDNALIYQDVTYYTKAYDKIYGLDIEEEDYDLFDKIVTINIVNTQLNAYTNHVKLDDYRGGLNDLFKGLLRFRKWFAHASALGAQDDIYLVRSVILSKLWEMYGIDEDEAMFVLNHYDYLKESYGEDDARLYYTRYIYEKVDRLGLGTGD